MCNIQKIKKTLFEVHILKICKLSKIPPPRHTQNIPLLNKYVIFCLQISTFSEIVTETNFPCHGKTSNSSKSFNRCLINSPLFAEMKLITPVQLIVEIGGNNDHLCLQQRGQGVMHLCSLNMRGNRTHKDCLDCCYSVRSNFNFQKYSESNS